MNLNRLATLLLLVGSLSSVALVGCQSTKLSHSNKIGAVNSDTNNEDWPTSTQQSYLLQALTKYDWQLTQVTGMNNKGQPFRHKPPLIMDIRPSSLLFKEGCHRYKLFIENAYPTPYPYSISHLVDSTNDCDTQSNVASKGAIQQSLETIFSPRSNLYFNFEPVTLKSNFFIPNSSKQLALNINNDMTLIFTGMRKPEQKTSGLPITNEILERYQWQIISATDKQNDPISNFNDPDVHIIAKFYTDSHRRTAGFSVGCNGVSGSYALAVNQTLLIGSSPQTMIGCGDLLNKIESNLSRTMLNSVSQLTLNLQEDTATSENSTQAMLKYLLTQQLDTGETFIWQNEKKEHRR